MDASGPSSANPAEKRPSIAPFHPNKDHNPRDLKAWARRTGFNPSFSGEPTSERDAASPVRLDLEKGIGRRRGGLRNNPEIESVLRQRSTLAENFGVEIGPAVAKEEREKNNAGIESAGVGLRDEGRVAGHEPLLRFKCDRSEGNGHGNGAAPVSLTQVDGDLKKEPETEEIATEIDYFSDGQQLGAPSGYKPPSILRAHLTENPGFSKCIFSFPNKELIICFIYM